jgi:peptidoglycan L-alanyl-D-glutamate endopeptidase CwlK
MFEFSKRSQNNRDTLHPNLIVLFDTALKTSPIDYSIICGYRGKEDQNQSYKEHKSDFQFPHSKHNSSPSLGADIQPFPYTDEDKNDPNHTKFRELSLHIAKVAKDLEIPVINGGLDWGHDWFHWELVL